ncbi:Octaprenyl diphosphate synthase / Dimethylallyltransferase / (2E,6E)-farnesyl diphosphate synthase / Geranylgeranyl pyrophosphate synthetase [Candidatus Burkholderia verschuerenii]|uniref:Octaprenyl diphosphate synthase / Dimethylallyltransferase / (2E,6E)-farnesyl diphosphate synthase / Geranylgeranyl pyrophosphate synthetase n=1 Tax=Candidatus Burkholderia verschuerenii TaxID=242163 RepID=A0A0L0M9A8_9BURK|nr:farnesyl diphosphate synthase [Candidatus Burkholderia verschuerenii]KND59252.1 Octaprenyl diphosphate synthase / Dimethylallyltransferase / (2E,6E)-farnesyl diphosphate synthase / Geranylgeranyl pyrophosphate synthetase [Candidatus Burkholderia verschuerenii]
MTFEQWMRATLDRVETALEHYLPGTDIAPARLHEAMRYAVLGGGKRVRPLLCHAAGELTGASAHAVEAASCALEMIHVYSLVHDDMPAMDDDALRRGKPTVHIQYDEATALLVGDALQSQAFVALTAEGNGLSDAQQAALVRELAVASGSVGMAGGQAIDLESVGRKLTRPELETMHRKKTGALLRASVRMGALAGTTPGADALAALDQYAAAVGLAFQVVDDILDVTADSATLGKTAGKDAQNDKPTYVSIIGLDASRELAAQLGRDAHAAIAPFGARGQRLAELADLVVNRVN